MTLIMKTFYLAIRTTLAHPAGCTALVVMVNQNMVAREHSTYTPLSMSYRSLNRLSCFSLVWGWPPLPRFMMKMIVSGWLLQSSQH